MKEKTKSLRVNVPVQVHAMLKYQAALREIKITELVNLILAGFVVGRRKS